MPEFGYDKYLKKLKDLFLNKYVDETLPYGDIYKGAWKGTVNVVSTANFLVPSPVSGHVVTAGRAMKMLFYRVWTASGAAVFMIVQTGAPANAIAEGVTDGTVDFPYLEAQGAEAVGPVGMANPIHVLAGTINWYIQEPSQAVEYSVSWWGVEDVGEPA